MRKADIVIAGGGLAGSIAATMLGRAGFDTVLVDPHPVYPPEFRCEKIDSVQMRVLERTGTADAIKRASTPDHEAWVARFGRVVEKRPGDQHGIMYDTLVNTIRAEIPGNVSVVHGKVMEIANTAEEQMVTLSDDSTITARLVVVANGLNTGLRHKLGMERDILSPNHSTSAGFDVEPVGQPSFKFSSLTYYSHRPSEMLAFITLFPIGTTMRANLFGYRDVHDPWWKQLRDRPLETLCAAMPRLHDVIGDFRVLGPVKVRPIDLYATRGTNIPGVVLVGDAYSTSCPAAGTGTLKVFTDVERLCNIHIPKWFATAGMGEEKIAAFYADPVKVACETYCLTKAYDLRSVSIGTAFPLVARRWAKFAGQLGRGTLRQARARMFT